MIKLFKYALLATGCFFVTAFSVGETDDDDVMMDSGLGNAGNPEYVGYYGGVWTIDGETVSAEPLVLSTPAPSCVIMGFDQTPYLSFAEFPFKAIAKMLFPNVDIAKITALIPYGESADEEQRLLWQIDSLYACQGDNAMKAIVKTRLRQVGYSEDMAYLELMPDGENAYVHYAAVATTTTGNRFVLVADVATWRTLNTSSGVSTVSMSLTHPSMSLLLVLKSLKCYDSNLKLIEETTIPERLLRFNSNRKSSSIIYK